MNKTENVIQQPSEEIQQPLSKQELNEEKRQKFIKLVRYIKLGILVAISLIITIIILRYIYIGTKKNFNVTNLPPTNNTKEPEVIIKPDEPGIITEELETYLNEPYRFSLKYPKNDKFLLQDTTDKEYFVKIISEEGLPQDANNLNLVRGYIVIVNPLTVSIRSLEDATNTKREWYADNCPTTAQISTMTDIKLDDLNGKSFQVENCNSDLKEYFVRANGYIYEIIQVYKGDLGFKQNYKAMSEAIVNSVKVNRDGEPEPDPFLYFDGGFRGFSFSYPRILDSSCCYVAPPPGKNIDTSIILSEGENDKTIGFFTDRDSSSVDFIQYVQQQKQILIDDYTVVKGFAPKGEEQELQIAGKKAVLLKNLSWKGNSIIYVEPSAENRILAISYTNIEKDILDGILGSLKTR